MQAFSPSAAMINVYWQLLSEVTEDSIVVCAKSGMLVASKSFNMLYGVCVNSVCVVRFKSKCGTCCR